MRVPILAALALTPALLAQPGGRTPTGTASGWPPGAVVGRVVDSATGAPLAGARVAQQGFGRPGRVPTDRDGRFVLDGLAPGAVTLEIHCPSRTLLGAPLGAVPARADTGRAAPVLLRVDRAACAEPDSGARRVTLRGLYTAGFEESRFVPCAGGALDALWAPGYLRRGAWVEFALGAGWARRRSAPDTSAGRYPRWYVEWRGTLTGPGRFGHLGVSPYLLTVRQVSAVRPVPPADCRPLARGPAATGALPPNVRL